MSDSFLGTYQGKVIDNADPSNGASVRLVVPQILGSAPTAWAKPSVITTKVPQVGDIVYVTFVGGDVAFPVYTATSDAASAGNIPKQPTAVAANVTTYATPEGITQALASVSWTAPTENIDGTVPVDLSGFQISYSYDDTNWSAASVTEDSSVVLNGLNTGQTLWIRVFSVSAAGKLSIPSVVKTATPNSPSSPPAGSTLAQIQASANGKNKITYSTVAPTNQPNSVGDTWFVYETVGMTIVAQYTGQGGTTWLQTTLNSQVVASLDVGKLTTNTLAAGQKIVAGTINGIRTELGGTGMTSYGYVQPPAQIASELSFCSFPSGYPSGSVFIGLTGNNPFSYAITALTAAGETLLSAVSNPQYPQNGVVPTVRWTPSQGPVTGYNVYRNSSSVPNWRLVGTTTSLSFTDLGYATGSQVPPTTSTAGLVPVVDTTNGAATVQGNVQGNTLSVLNGGSTFTLTSSFGTKYANNGNAAPKYRIGQATMSSGITSEQVAAFLSWSGEPGPTTPSGSVGVDATSTVTLSSATLANPLATGSGYGSPVVTGGVPYIYNGPIINGITRYTTNPLSGASSNTPNSQVALSTQLGTDGNRVSTIGLQADQVNVSQVLRALGVSAAVVQANSLQTYGQVTKQNYEAGMWVPYTPVLLATGGGLTVGTGSTFAGKYMVIGNTVEFHGYVNFGSGFNAGSGNWTLNLPFAAKDVNVGGSMWVSPTAGTYVAAIPSPVSATEAGKVTIWGPQANPGTLMYSLGGSGAGQPGGTAWTSAGWVRWTIKYESDQV